MFKTIRVLLALCVFVPLTLLFLDCYERVQTEWHLPAHLQFTTAVVGGLAAPLVFILLITLLFGRIYCSVICPFGILQDVISRIGGIVLRPPLLKRKNKPQRFTLQFRKESIRLRYPLMLLFAVGLFVPSAFITVILLDPYSNYGRIMNAIVRPLAVSLNNLFSGWTIGNMTLHRVLIHINWFEFITALAFLLLAGVLAFFFGRRYCNTICPVGTLLGLLSKIALFKIRLKSNCVSCGLCEKVCKGECINSKDKTVYHSRCVECFNCLSVCKKKAITFTVPLQKQIQSVQPQKIKEPPLPCHSIRRRGFLRQSVLGGLTFAGAAVFLQQMLTAKKAKADAAPDSSLPTATSVVSYKKKFAVLPPGAKHLRHFQSKCTGCHLCVAKCPANVLTPSMGELGFNGLLQPIAKFEYGFCNYNCTICTKVCPTHALIPVETKEEKHLVQIGEVVFIKENCVVHIKNTSCGACAEHCPTGAIEMKPYGDPTLFLTLPVVHTELCIGCGACENICPVRPYRAIYIEGLETQGKAKPAVDSNEKQQEVKKVNFGF
ncbi:MAG: 4Fe-4S binding protein [Planctomycetaceae bacterium]|nr:4Fe-4S binding protein [Planctomycetaceae bacterium]